MTLKQTGKVLLAIGIILLAVSYLFSGVFTFPDISLLTLEKHLAEVFLHPWRNWWNDKTLLCIGIGFIIWLFIGSFMIAESGKYMEGREHGDAKWADVKKVNKKFAGEKVSENRILSEHLRVTYDTNKSDMNNNTIYIGGSGKGKGFRNIIPNIANGSERALVVTDAKGSTLALMGNYLERKRGYDVRALNLIEFEKSLHYNPFAYLENEEDVNILVDNIMANTKDKDAAVTGDGQFWEDGPKMLTIALFDYIWLEYPPHRQNWTTFFELLDMVSPDEEKNMFMEKMQLLEDTSPMGANHPAVKNYKIFQGGAQETMGSILMVLNARLQVFRLENVQWLMSSDELGLYDVGSGVNGNPDKKVALFFLIPDENVIYSAIVGMVYTQLLQILFRQARQNSDVLPFKVVMHLDEYPNIKMPKDFIREIATIRSRGICANIYIQNLAQLKSLHKDDWETIMENCDTLVYLGTGTGGKGTFEYISELLGEYTLNKRSQGIQYGMQGHTTNNKDIMARKLLQPYELRKLPTKECIVFLPESDPVKDMKYQTQNKAWFKEAVAWGEYGTQPRAERYGNYNLLWRDVEKMRISFLSPEEMAMLQKQGNHNIISISEEDLLALEFDNSLPMDGAAIKNLMQRRKAETDAAEEAADAEIMDLSEGTAYDWIKRYPLNVEQTDEILQALEDGMTDDEIRKFFDPNLPAKKMNQMRRLLKAAGAKGEKVC